MPQKEKFLFNVTLTELTFIIFLIFILLFSRKVLSLTKNLDTVNKTNEELLQKSEDANRNYINSLSQIDAQKKTIYELGENNDNLFKKLTLHESSVNKCEEFMNQFHEEDMSFSRLFDSEELLSEIKELKEDKSQLESKLEEFEKEAKNREQNLRRRCGNDWPASR